MNTHINKWFNAKISEYKNNDPGRECAYSFAKLALDKGGKFGHPEKTKRKFIPQDGKIRKYLFEKFNNNIVILQFVVHKDSKIFDLLKYPIYSDTSYINKRIETEYCINTVNGLTDTVLMPEYMKCKSLSKNIEILQVILTEHNDEKTSNEIIKKYMPKLIPSGTKGVIRGNKFNDVVKQFILNLPLDSDKFEICFEKNCNKHVTSEIPDWFILEKSNDKTIIGMNQLDLWGGGQQINRGYKYLINNNNNNENCKLLCVVCNKTIIKNKKSKVYKLFETGFQNDTLCYLNNLQNIITSYFHLY